MAYAFTLDSLNCPSCGMPLGDRDGPKSLLVTSGRSVFEAVVGDECDFYNGYLLDPAGCGCLVLDDPRPEVRCLGCNSVLRVNVEDET